MDAREQAEQHLTQHREGRLDQRKACGGGNGVADVGTRTRFGQPYLAGVPRKGCSGKGLISEQMWGLERDDLLDDVRSRARRGYPPDGPDSVGVPPFRACPSSPPAPEPTG